VQYIGAQQQQQHETSKATKQLYQLKLIELKIKRVPTAVIDVVHSLIELDFYSTSVLAMKLFTLRLFCCYFCYRFSFSSFFFVGQLDNSICALSHVQ
jgi:hypothetical protein